MLLALSTVPSPPRVITRSIFSSSARQVCGLQNSCFLAHSGCFFSNPWTSNPSCSLRKSSTITVRPVCSSHSANSRFFAGRVLSWCLITIRTTSTSIRMLSASRCWLNISALKLNVLYTSLSPFRGSTSPGPAGAALIPGGLGEIWCESHRIGDVFWRHISMQALRSFRWTVVVFVESFAWQLDFEWRRELRGSRGLLGGSASLSEFGYPLTWSI